MSRWLRSLGGWRRGVSAAVCGLGVLVCALLIAPSGRGEAAQAVPDEASRTPDERDTVVLLHGLARSSFSMNRLASALEDAGYTTANVDYPSTGLEAEALGGMLQDRIDACCRDAARLHFVTHSLGGIVVRAYLAEHRPPNLGRVVMLAPPNHVSEWVDALRDTVVFGWIMGPTAMQLGTDPDSLPNRLPPADYPLGVIAGNRVVNPLGAGLIDGADDGTVSVERTQLEGMTDFIELPTSHTFIMYSDEVARQVIVFLRTGGFDHAPVGPAGSAEDGD